MQKVLSFISYLLAICFFNSRWCSSKGGGPSLSIHSFSFITSFLCLSLIIRPLRISILSRALYICSTIPLLKIVYSSPSLNNISVTCERTHAASAWNARIVHSRTPCGNKLVLSFFWWSYESRNFWQVFLVGNLIYVAIILLAPSSPAIWWKEPRRTWKGLC